MVIRGVTTAFPSLCIENGTIADWCQSDTNFLAEKVGIVSRYFLNVEEDELDLACAASSRLFTMFPNLAEDIRLVIYVGQAKKTIIPHASALLQHRLGLSSQCAAFDIGLACSGYVYALAIAEGFMATHRIHNALLVTCDPYSLIMGRTNRDTVPLFGDAASATLLSTSGTGLHVGKYDLGTDGSKASFLEYERTSELTMNGRGIFNFAMQYVPLSVQRCLEANGVTKDAVDYFFLHQANKFILEALCGKLGITQEKCPVCVAETANTVSSSIPLVIEKYFAKLRHGQSVVMSGFGGGLSWATTCATFLEENHD